MFYYYVLPSSDVFRQVIVADRWSIPCFSSYLGIFLFINMSRFLVPLFTFYIYIWKINVCFSQHIFALMSLHMNIEIIYLQARCHFVGKVRGAFSQWLERSTLAPPSLYCIHLPALASIPFHHISSYSNDLRLILGLLILHSGTRISVEGRQDCSS
jgi:hypothetical protein